MSIPTNKNLATDIAPHTFYALINLQLGKNVLLFSYDIKHCYYHILLNKLFGLGFI